MRAFDGMGLISNGWVRGPRLFSIPTMSRARDTKPTRAPQSASAQVGAMHCGPVPGFRLITPAPSGQFSLQEKPLLPPWLAFFLPRRRNHRTHRLAYWLKIQGVLG